MMGRDDCRWNVSVSTDDGGNWLGASPSRVLGSEPRWSALLPIGPFVEPEVTSADTERDGRLREVAVTGALQVTFPPVGRAVRYASVGGGYVQVSGELPSSGVVGTYRFRICGEHLFEQVDAVTPGLRATAGHWVRPAPTMPFPGWPSTPGPGRPVTVGEDEAERG